ncbi:putative electron transport protein YccM [bacterium BMS3Abin04]|nr:putative electron transport protein YccM [bacterium BMS3Abin04]
MADFKKNKDKQVQKQRFLVQLFFTLLTFWIGVQFYLFIKWLESGGNTTFVNRPPGVEAFLPISSLMSVYYFLQTGNISQVHPAGFFIFIAIVSISLIFGKSFCSWVCPFGFLSELIGDFGEKMEKKLFKKKLVFHKIFDYPLRSLKYLILAFFAYSIFFTMSKEALKVFLNSSYNILVDVKLYYFFAHITEFSFFVIVALFALSIIFRNFWCRYLCPYGALLGIISFFSPNKIKRDTTSCIDCGLCTKACPSNIKVDKVKTVISDECTMCLGCIDACPVADTLEITTLFPKKKVFNKKYVGYLILGVYFLITSIGVVSNHWHSNVSRDRYLSTFQNIRSVGHPTDTEQIKKLNEQAKKKNNNTSLK